MSACSVPFRTSSASSLWSAARAIAVWQMVMTCRRRRLVLDDADILFDVKGIRNPLRQVCKVSRTPDCVQFPLTLERIADRDGVNRATDENQAKDRSVNTAVRI